MNDREFVRALRIDVVDGSVATYRDLLESPPSAATDPYWQRVLTLAQALPAPQRRILVELVRQVTVDTLSHVLGLLDGSTMLPGAPDFELTCEGKRIDGTLQDLFLELEETR